MQIIAMKFKNFWIARDLSTKRQNVLTFALCLIAAYGFVFSSLGGETRSEAAHQALMIGGLVVLLAPFLTKQQPQLSRSRLSGLKKSTAVIVGSVLGIFTLGYASFAIQDRVATRSLESIIEGKSSEPGLSKTVNLLTLASQSGVVVSPPLLDAAYHRLAGTSEHPADMKAWETALNFVSYRTSRNQNYRPSGALSRLPPETWHYVDPAVSYIEGRSKPVMMFSNQALPSEKAARFDDIGVDRNGGLSVGPAFLIARDGAIRVDYQHIRNVVFDGVEVHYDGSPLILENVVFINCTFVMDNSDQGRRLGEAVLASDEVNFKDLS